jgi:hypothetical protein
MIVFTVYRNRFTALILNPVAFILEPFAFTPYPLPCYTISVDLRVKHHAIFRTFAPRILLLYISMMASLALSSGNT